MKELLTISIVSPYGSQNTYTVPEGCKVVAGYEKDKEWESVTIPSAIEDKGNN